MPQLLEKIAQPQPREPFQPSNFHGRCQPRALCPWLSRCIRRMVDEKRNAVLEQTKKSTSNRTKLPETATLPEPSTLALLQSLAQGSNIQTDNMQLTMHYNALRILFQSIAESPFTYSWFQEQRAATATHRTSCSSASCTAWTSKNSLMFDLRGWPWEILSILGMVLDETFWKLKGTNITVFQSKNKKQHQNQTKQCSSNTYSNPFSFSTSPVILRDLTQVVVGILNLLDQTLAQLASAANASNPFGNLTSTGIGRSITGQRHGFGHRSIAYGLLAMLGLKGQNP